MLLLTCGLACLITVCLHYQQEVVSLSDVVLSPFFSSCAAPLDFQLLSCNKIQTSQRSVILFVQKCQAAWAWATVCAAITPPSPQHNPFTHSKCKAHSEIPVSRTCQDAQDPNGLCRAPKGPLQAGGVRGHQLVSHAAYGEWGGNFSVELGAESPGFESSHASHARETKLRA